MYYFSILGIGSHWTWSALIQLGWLSNQFTTSCQPWVHTLFPQLSNDRLLRCVLRFSQPVPQDECHLLQALPHSQMPRWGLHTGMMACLGFVDMGDFCGIPTLWIFFQCFSTPSTWWEIQGLSYFSLLHSDFLFSLEYLKNSSLSCKAP